MNIHGVRVEFVIGTDMQRPLQWFRTRSSSTRGAESETV
jgi:hypothetical protein